MPVTVVAKLIKNQNRHTKRNEIHLYKFATLSWYVCSNISACTITNPQGLAIHVRMKDMLDRLVIPSLYDIWTNNILIR